MIASPLEYYVRIDRDKTDNWIKKYSSSGEIIIRAKFKKHLKLICNLIESSMKQIIEK